MHLSGEGRAVLPGRSENFWAETTVELGLEGRGMQEKAGSPGRGESVRTGVRVAWGECEWCERQSSGRLALWVSELGPGQPGHERGPCVHSDVCGTLSFPSSEFSSALEYLKLLNSFVDSVGIVTAPFSSSCVLKSALGKHLVGQLRRPQVA